MSSNEGEFREVLVPETTRTCIFPSGEVTVPGVSKVCVRPSGSHRLETVGGAKYIIPPGWLAMKLDVADWSF